MLSWGVERRVERRVIIIIPYLGAFLIKYLLSIQLGI